MTSQNSFGFDGFAPQSENLEPQFIQTDVGAKDGQTKCPKCGATEIQTNTKTGKLRCNFCRYEFELKIAFSDEQDVNQLSGIVSGSGAQDIVADTSDIITLKCESCGAEVVIDTASAAQARCHWCRNTLSINKQIPNGAIPDAVLPFKTSKQDARTHVEKFVNARKFFAHPTFLKEFTTENICAVYFPYMLVDVNAHASLSGTGEHLVRKYQVKINDEQTVTYYDADAYHVERDFDIAIDDLTIEASQDKLDTRARTKTTNVINAIMPFDTENLVHFDANYLRGCTSEKRDVNADDLRPLVKAQAQDVARIATKQTLKNYDRGVCWKHEEFQVKGERWNSVYLPVWLYSYMQKKGNRNLLHYVAVNARTNETMGSVPINVTRLLLFSILCTILGGVAAFFLGMIWDLDWYRWLLLLAGPLFYAVIYSRQRNAGARHYYERETKREIANMQQIDRFIERRTRLLDSSIKGRNESELHGTSMKALGQCGDPYS